MPCFDGTGPTGRGRMTGRGMGRCRALNNSGRISSPAESRTGDQTEPAQGLGRRIGPGCGMGRGRGRGFKAEQGGGKGV